VIRWMACSIAGFLKPKALLVAENLCLRQQLMVLQRRQPRPRLLGADRRFWILEGNGIPAGGTCCSLCIPRRY
jgi:hypothetical protein